MNGAPIDDRPVPPPGYGYGYGYSYGLEAETPGLDLRRVWHVVVKRKLLLLGVLATALLIGLAATMLSTPVYRASTTLQIDREAAQVVNVEGVMPSDDMYSAQEFYQTQYGLLKSRALAQKVVNQLGLANQPAFIESNRLGRVQAASGRPTARSAASAGARNRAAVNQLLSNLGVSPAANSRLVAISYDSPDPRLAQQVANAVAENFIASNLERRYEASSYARRFLEERLEQLRTRLEDAERELVGYAASENIITLPTQNDQGAASRGPSLVSSSLAALNGQLASAQAERIQAEARWRAAERSTGLGLAEIQSSATVQALRQQRAGLAGQLQEQLQQFQPEYPSVRQLQVRVDELDRQILAETRDVKTSLQRSYQSALAQEQALRAEIGRLQGQSLDLDRRSIRYNILQRDLDTNRTLYDGLLQRYREIGVAGGVGTNNVSIVDRAEQPTSPVLPKPMLNMALAAALGLLIGGLIAFLLEFLDETLRTPAEVESKLGLALLGSVPKLPAGQTPATALEDPRSGFSEAYHSVRSALQFARPEGTPRSLLVTSSQPAEGKSTTALALARAFARTGQRVLLIDGDARDPSLHKLLNLGNRVGLSSILNGTAALSAAVQPTDQPTLGFMGSGPRPPSPADLLSSPNLVRLLDHANGSFDLVIIDGPPVMGLADATIIGAAAEAVLFVTAAKGVRKAVAMGAIRRVQSAGGDVIGGVLTKFDARHASQGGYGYDYAYSYEYGAEEPAGDEKPRKRGLFG
jgi:capsular exopolysaccharide synthesis family protein